MPTSYNPPLAGSFVHDPGHLGGLKHTGIRCDVCSNTNFSGRRYKCLVCPDYDQCGSCRDAYLAAGRAASVHVSNHPMQCILSDLGMYFGMDSVQLKHAYSFTCSLCGEMGLEEKDLFNHLESKHAEKSHGPVWCPICVTVDESQRNTCNTLMTDDLLEHVCHEHGGDSTGMPGLESSPSPNSMQSSTPTERDRPASQRTRNRFRVAAKTTETPMPPLVSLPASPVPRVPTRPLTRVRFGPSSQEFSFSQISQSPINEGPTPLSPTPTQSFIVFQPSPIPGEDTRFGPALRVIPDLVARTTGCAPFNRPPTPTPTPPDTGGNRAWNPEVSHGPISTRMRAAWLGQLTQLPPSHLRPGRFASSTVPVPPPGVHVPVKDEKEPLLLEVLLKEKTLVGGNREEFRQKLLQRRTFLQEVLLMTIDESWDASEALEEDLSAQKSAEMPEAVKSTESLVSSSNMSLFGEH